MTTKKDLIKKFQKTPNRYWKVELFDDLGFRREQCIKCGKFFWTLTEQQMCNDASCRPYEFIGNPPIKKKFDYFTAWKAIERFFVKNGHTALKRYPVVCRWYPLFFTIAGIIDFYRIENGKISFEFPANPTILPQICLRFNNIPNVGITGRADTSFCMVQQTSLWDGKNGYWKDECIDLDFRMLTEVFGIKPEDIVFIEDAWLGESAFGNSLEYHVKGAELGNAVFTEFAGTPDNYREMKEKVIDMGAGLERYAWISQGTPTLYDAVSGPIINRLNKLAGIKYDDLFLRYAKLAGSLNLEDIPDIEIAFKDVAKQLGVDTQELKERIEPIRAVYSIVDHAKTLLFAITDNAIPSNVSGGYNLRVVLRRALSFIDKFQFPFDIYFVVEQQARFLKPMHPELLESLEQVNKILKIEEKRYKNTKERSKRIVESLAGRKISEEELIKLYDSDGITPEQLGVEVPPDFYVKVTERHMGEKPVEEKLKFDVSDLPETKLLFYENPDLSKFEAKVLKVLNDRFVVLDKSAFYAEAGGQLSDRGTIDGIEVVDVQKIGNVIIHQLAEKVKEGKVVSCKVDKRRREILTRHHTATHIINYAAREILGSHVWQHGAKKDVDKARLDITHYESLTDEEVEKIENLANEVVEKDLPVKIEVLPRNKAEEKYGFRIYQGGAVPEKNLRIVSVGTIDHEACGGTHCTSTGEVGFITVLRTKRIQDGVCRIEYCSGEVALKHLKEKEKILKKVAEKLKVEDTDVPKAIKRLFESWKKLRKQLKKVTR
ncbi:MAG: alanine--tRNA ligase [Candidatus Aenigmarchaeota archaeon]|nr:alanine--tRNA ligase [Candidatus Aenigmarchaeota archaeon]